MDGALLTLWIMRLTFVALIYLFFFVIARALWRDLRASAAGAGAALGRLVVTSSAEGGPASGTNYPLDAVNSSSGLAAAAGDDPGGEACGDGVRRQGSSLPQSSVKQETLGARPGIPVL